MIWGKTYKQKIDKYFKLKEQREIPRPVFLYLPKVLKDGRWCWLQKAWKVYSYKKWMYALRKENL